MPPMWLVWVYAHRTLVEIAAAVLLLTIFAAAWSHHERSRGAQNCENQKTATLAAQLQSDLTESSRQSAEISKEAQIYASQTASAINFPAVGNARILCDDGAGASSSAVRGTAAAGSKRDGGLRLPGGNPGGGAAPADRSASAAELAELNASNERLAKIGQKANAQMGELKAYIANVCKPAIAAESKK